LKVIPLEISDVKIIEPDPFIDHRGFFMKIYNKKTFEEYIGDFEFAEEDESGSLHNVLRGLHYQVHNPQGKLITIATGEIFDVAVDLRKSSLTFGKWVSAILSAKDKKEIWIPPGFAHGFYALSDYAQIVYRTTTHYTPTNDRTLLWNDPDINIKWPIPEGTTPIMSKKDLNGALFKNAEVCD
jgi:dTDP-4-dehydrorhamnose 3,5-epimerase